MVRTKPRRSRRYLVVGAAVLMLVAGCGARPDLDRWEAQWLDLADMVSAQLAAPAPPERSACDRLLGDLRAALPGLRPAPNDVLEEAVVSWAEFGESVFFECPLVRGEHAGWDAGILELQRLRTEIDAEIEFERAQD